jgi:hypothetical protein
VQAAGKLGVFGLANSSSWVATFIPIWRLLLRTFIILLQKTKDLFLVRV